MSQPISKYPFYYLALAVFAIFFIAGGIAHFVLTPAYVRVVPPYLPWPLALVYTSGVCEVLGGLGLLYPPTRRFAAWGLVALLVAVFPANLFMAMTHAGYAGPAWVLWVRLPLQIPLIWWAWSYTRREQQR
jgi:uncharacterized membrane protein